MARGRSPLDAQDGDLPLLCNRANSGSAWSALVIALNVKPTSLAELLRVVGIPKHGKHRERAFDAVADAWAIYEDAVDQGAHL